MTWVVMALGMLMAAVTQTVLPGYPLLGQAKFPFLICVVLYYALNRESHVVMVAGFAAGFLQDVLSEIPFGYSTFCFWLLGLILSRFRTVVLTESLATRVVFGGLVGVASTLVLYLLLAGNGHVSCPARWAVLKILGTGLLGMICGPIALAVMGGLDRLVGNIDMKEEFDGIEC